MENWESICSVVEQDYVRHTRHLLPVLNNFYLLVNTTFFCCCDYLQAILSSGVAIAIAASQDTTCTGN